MIRQCRISMMNIAVLTFLAAGWPPAMVHGKSSAAPSGASSAKGPIFSKGKIKIGKKLIAVEFADTPEKREHGLMFREHLPENQGMLFIFESEQLLAFWMKNTLIPLSIGYFDSQRRLIEVHEMVPAVMGEARPRTYPSSKPAQYALEMPKEWFSRNGIKVGTSFTITHATK